MKNRELSAGGGFITGVTVGAIIGGVVTYLLVTPSGRRITHWLMDIADELSHHGEEIVGIETPQPTVKEVQKKLEKKSVDRS